MLLNNFLKELYYFALPPKLWAPWESGPGDTQRNVWLALQTLLAKEKVCRLRWPGKQPVPQMAGPRCFGIGESDHLNCTA